jgi:hypothetical protein
MAVNDGDKDVGNGEGRGHIGRRQEGREVDAGRGASNLMQPAMRGSSEEKWRGEGESCLGGREGNYRSLMSVFVRCRKVDRSRLEVYSLSAASEPNPLLQVPGRCLLWRASVH